MKADEKKCPACAETIKADARVCRHCRHEFSETEIAEAIARKKSTGKKAGIGCLALIVAVVGIGAIVGGDANKTAPAGTPAVATKARAVTATELARAYAANEVAAQNSYGNQTLEVTGTITGVDLDFANDPVVKLAGVNQFQDVQLSFSKDYAGKTGGLRKGDNFTANCAKISEVIGTPMLDDCSF